MKELLKPDGSSTGVWCFEVSEDAYDFEIFNTYRKEVRYLHKDSENPLTGGEKHSVIPIEQFTTLQPVTILGTCTDKVIDLDVSVLFGGMNDGSGKVKLVYVLKFRSLLAQNGLYWVNPFGKKPEMNQYNWGEDEAKYYRNDLAEWQISESKKLTGNLVFIKNN